MRILITGASGFVGSNLAWYFGQKKKNKVFGGFLRDALGYDKATKWVFLDIANLSVCKRVVTQCKPDIVIHCAGLKDVSLCEKYPEEAMRLNANGTANVAKACRDHCAQLVYLSTDYVFDGVRGGYDEYDEPHPSTTYGTSKLLGEQLLRIEMPNALICRSSGIYGANSPLLLWAKKIVLSNEPLFAYTNVINTPTYVINLAEQIEALVKRGWNGTVHTVGNEAVSRYEFFEAFMRVYSVDLNLLRRSVSEHNRGCLLPNNISLERDRAEKCLHGVPIDNPFNGLTRFKDERR